MLEVPYSMRIELEMKSLFKITLISAAYVILGFGISFSRISLKGELGLDLNSHIFDSVVKNKDFEMDLNRSQSRHYLRLSSSGEIVSKNFATFALGTELFGTYLSTRSKDDEKNLYISPRLQSYNAVLSIFPLRHYPLTLNIDKSRRNILRYEQTNRTSTNLLSPELAIVRRYDTESFIKGLNWNYAMSEKVRFSSSASSSKLKSIRAYDFNEDLNIWITVSEVFSNPANPVKTVTIENGILDDTIIVYIDYALVDSIIPGQRIETDVIEGLRYLEIYSSKYNTFTRQLDVSSDLLLKVVYVRPQGSEDTEQTSNNYESSLTIESNKIKDNLSFSYSDMENPRQNLTSTLSNINNKNTLRFTENASLSIASLYSKTTSDLDTVSSQSSTILENKTSFGYALKSGISTALNHTFSRSNSINEGIETINKEQSYSNSINFPYERINSSFSLNNTYSTRSNNTGYSNKSYTISLNARSTIQTGKWELTPENILQYGINNQTGPDISSHQIRDNLILTGERKDFWYLGNVRFQNQLDFTRSTSNDFVNTIKVFTFDLSFLREFAERYQLSGQTIQKIEDTGGNAPTPGQNEDQQSPGRDRQVSSTYRIGLRYVIRAKLSVSSVYIITKQNDANINSMSLNLFLLIPKFDIPFTSSIIRRSNKLEGLPEQTQLTNENKIKIRFRQIFINIEHVYNRENLPNEKYKYHEFYGTITRAFNIL
jgi:hypothetical protein